MARKKRKKQPRKHGGFQDRVSDLALRGFIGVMALFPVRTRLNIVGWIMRRAVAPLLGWNKRAEANLELVWPGLDPEERRRIADASIDNFARAFVENYDPKEMLARGAAYPVTGPGLDALNDAVETGRPVLLLSGHYGNPICGRCALIARGYTVGGVLRPMSNPFSNKRYVQNYRDVGEPVFEQGRRGTMAMLKYVRQGGIVAMLFDVFESSGALIDFLGHPAPTALSAAEIALKTDAVLIPYFAIRRTDGYGFDAILEEPIAHSTAEAMMQEATKRLEARIKDDPGQWMWVHRRWKPKRLAKRQRKRAAATMGP